MKSLRIKAAALSCLVLAAPSLAAADDNLFTSPDGAFAISGGIGLANIKAGEFVYSGSHKLSQLDWESKGVTLYTIGLDAQIDKSWSVKGSFNVGTGGDGSYGRL